MGIRIRTLVRKVEKRRTITRKRRKVKELKNFDEGVWERVGQSQENEVKEENEVKKIKRMQLHLHKR